MKKVIVAAAGLMLVGTMASTAMAEFMFSGDARTRYFYENNYNQAVVTPSYQTDDDNASFFTSRVRFKIEADTKGGAYVKTRLRLNDNWGSNGTGAYALGVNTDYAYIGVPFGPVTVEGGRVVRDVTPFFYYDGRADAIQMKYKNDKTGLVVFYDTNLETDFNDSFTYDDDESDSVLVGGLLNQEFDGGWKLSVGALYASSGEATLFPNSSTPVTIDDEDGFGATVHVDGTVGNVALAAELAYQQEDFQKALFGGSATDDDGFGGYIQATIPVGAVSLTGLAGFTADGFVMDAADFGPWILLQDYSQIAIGTNFTEFGESMFVAIVPSYKVSEQLTIGAQASYANVDPYGDGDDQDLFEVGATASYAVTDGAALNAIVGWADADDLADDDLFGVGLELAIKF